ncbi:MAG: hypothetical protein CML51_05960 [Rhodobacteraceae bacterium]|nr:hypothetical protein [Paracoccaceae bacterium]|tara:strand:+ start:303 stop:1856 length:1554 start_codon:yes stop_codon:yes gene_type:complete
MNPPSSRPTTKWWVWLIVAIVVVGLALGFGLGFGLDSDSSGGGGGGVSDYSNPFVDSTGAHLALMGDTSTESYQQFGQFAGFWLSSNDMVSSTAASALQKSQGKKKRRSGNRFNSRLNMSQVKGSPPSTLESLVAGITKANANTVLPIVVYNLPNRDCSASSSNGELTTLDEYKDYIDSIVAVLENDTNIATHGIRVVFVLEPDGIANIADPDAGTSCAENVDLYMESLLYAAEQLESYGTLYLDAGHSAWISYTAKLGGLMDKISSTQWGNDKPLASYIRGFATNTSNYHALGTTAPVDAFTISTVIGSGTTGIRTYCCDPGDYSSGCQGGLYDPVPMGCEGACTEPILDSWTTANNEANFMTLLQLQAAASGIQFNSPDGLAHSVSDISRNGFDALFNAVDSTSPLCTQWCNTLQGRISKYPPNAKTYFDEDSNLGIACDAVLWVKPPGEGDGNVSTDGCCGTGTGGTCMQSCDNTPAAGEWFSDNANTLCQTSTYATNCEDTPQCDGISDGRKV